MTLSYLGHQNHLSTTENPLDFSGIKVMQRLQQDPKGMAQNKALQGLRGGKQPPTKK